MLDYAIPCTKCALFIIHLHISATPFHCIGSKSIGWVESCEGFVQVSALWAFQICMHKIWLTLAGIEMGQQLTASWLLSNPFAIRNGTMLAPVPLFTVPRFSQQSGIFVLNSRHALYECLAFSPEKSLQIHTTIQQFLAAAQIKQIFWRTPTRERERKTYRPWEGETTGA